MSYTKQVIGNQGIVKPRPSDTKPRTSSYPRRISNPEFAQVSAFAEYPGLGGGQFPMQIPTQVTPFAQAGAGAGGGAGGGALNGLASLFGGGSAAAGGAGSGFNIAQLKTVIDKLGGIEGIVDTFGKMQKVFSSVQQMAPMIKLLLGTFGKGRKTAAGDEDGDAPVARRRRKRRGAANARRRKRRR